MTRAPLTDDVLRGLRWGAILLAGLAIGVACYRLLLEAPPKSANPAPVSEPVQQVPERIAPPPAPKPRARPAVDSTVPSPPPVSGKASR